MGAIYRSVSEATFKKYIIKQYINRKILTQICSFANPRVNKRACSSAKAVEILTLKKRNVIGITIKIESRLVLLVRYIAYPPKIIKVYVTTF